MSLPRTLKGIKERVKIIGDTITGALKINKTLIVDGDALFNANTIMKGILKVGVNYGDEGGEIRLEASPDTPEENGIVLDQCDSKFRIYGIQSADGTTKMGVGTPLIIDPYNKLFDGNYNINANKIISKDTLLIDRGEWNQIILNTIKTNKKTYLQSGNIDNDLQDFTISNFYDMTNSKRNSFTFRTSSQGGVRANDLFIYDHVAGKTYMVYGQHNKPTAADVGALSLTNGGTVTGNIHIKAGYGGPEGGQFSIAKPENQHNFQSDVIVDVYTNQFRVFSAHNNATKVFNFDFNTLEGHATVYHTQNIRNGSGSTPSNLPDQGIYIKY